MSAKRLNPLVAIRSIARPIVRYCLRQQVNIASLFEVIRGVFVEEAAQEIRATGGEPNTSRISIATGIHRSEVVRITAGDPRPSSGPHLLQKVIGLWSQGAPYKDKKTGQVCELLYQGIDSEFSQLVAKVSKDVSPYTVLSELERIKAVECIDQKVRLLTTGYTDTSNVDHGLTVLSQDIEDLMGAVESNLSGEINDHNLHLRTHFDNIPPDKLPEIREWLAKRGADFHREVQTYLAAYDRDITEPETVLDAQAPRGRVSCTSFSHAYTPEPLAIIKPKKRGRKKHE